MKKILVFDTTLRDGEQSPGAKLNKDQKLEIARQLVRLNMDVLEAGFPSSSPGDLEAVKLIAGEIKGPVITALARAVKRDIDAVWEGVRIAERPMIHIVLGSSDIHLKNKFGISRDACLEMGVEAVKYAKSLCPHVQYSTEDATRSDFEYLCRFVEAVIMAGATVVNLPDTVGYAVPGEFGSLIRRLKEKVPSTDKVILSVHCHNDLGLASANTLEAIKNGVDQVEVTVNGVGERAGNASLEEVAMALKVRKDYYGVETGINTSEIIRTSRMVSSIMDIPVQPNRPIVGSNAFSHSSGIHQDGILKDRSTYEIICPEEVGEKDHFIRLTARSGRHAVRYRLEKLGYHFSGEHLEIIHKRFLETADLIKEVGDEDLVRIVDAFLLK